MGGEDAVGPAAAAQIDDAIAGVDLRRIQQSAGAVVETAIREDPRTRHETQRGRFVGAHLKGLLVPAPRPIAFAPAPEDCVAGGRRHMYAAEHFLQGLRQDSVIFEWREDDEVASRG